MRAALLVVAAVGLTGCGPYRAPANAPSRPCPQITEAEFEAALADGAARGDARIHRSGTVDLTFGPGVRHCSTWRSGMRTCRRPNDLVIRYVVDGGETLHVRVRADSEYRFHAAARPTTCQIVNENPPGG
jgi:hypothetical protein